MLSSEQNTRYLVELTANAVRDLEFIYRYIDGEGSHAAARWFNGLEDLILSLDLLPDRGVQAPEDRNLRQLLYGNKPHIYRIIYGIDRVGSRVNVLHIRHGARSAFQPRDIGRLKS